MAGFFSPLSILATFAKLPAKVMVWLSDSLQGLKGFEALMWGLTGNSAVRLSEDYMGGVFACDDLLWGETELVEIDFVKKMLAFA
jgi:hypothetical protein